MKPKEKNRTQNQVKQKLWLAVALVLFLINLIIIIGPTGLKKVDFSFFQPRLNSSPLSQKPEASCQDCLRRAIDGVSVKPGQENFYPVAVVIDNQIEARPAAGLAQANLVYEVEAEAGITRFLAIFASGEEIAAIGPVRSLRPYLIDWVNELSAILVHCGGSPEALVKISQSQLYNLNEFYQGSFFWRDQNKTSPHNIYISSQNLAKFLEKQGLAKGNFQSWQFKDDLAPELRPKEAEIKIVRPAASYLVKWKYNQQKNDYFRYQADEVQRDQAGKLIRAKNVIIEYVKTEVIDQVLRVRLSNLGSGQALICLDGRCQTGSWQKQESSSRSRFYDQEKNEIKFNAGTTWIEVVRPEIEVKY